jgi:hypothetical protein
VWTTVSAEGPPDAASPRCGPDCPDCPDRPGDPARPARPDRPGRPSKPPDRAWTAWIGRALILAACTFSVGSYLYIAFRQLGYPYELEWMEGGMVEIVARVAHGQPIYTAPTLHYVSYTYTPLYYWVAAQLARLTGIGFLPLRLVSIAASLGSFALLYRLVRRETGDPMAGVVAMGLFAAAFSIAGAWLDIGRVDSLLLFFMLAAVAAARHVRTWRGGIVVGILVFLAFFTKQTGLIALLPLLAYLVATRRQAGLAALGTTAATVAGSTLVLQAASHGWYWYFIFGELTHQPALKSAALHFVPIDIAVRFGFAAGLAVVGLVVGRWRRVGTAAWPFFVVVALGFAAGSFVSRVHSGGGRETLIPLYAAIALLSGLAYDAIRRSAPKHPALVGSALAIVIAGQVGHLGQDPSHYIPTAKDVAAGKHLVQMVADTPGEVIVLNHPWYATMAGKQAWAQGEAIHEVLRSEPGAARSDLLRSIDRTLSSGKVRAIYFDARSLGAFEAPVTAHFQPGGQVFSCYRCFFPPTDVAFRPYLLYVRK